MSRSALILLASLRIALADDLSFTLHHQDGGHQATYSYLSHDKNLRIAQLGEHSPPPPLNLFDFAKNNLRILRPINQSYEDIPLANLTLSPPTPGPTGVVGASPPPGTPPDPPAIPSPPPGVPNIPEIPGLPLSNASPMPPHGMPGDPGMFPDPEWIETGETQTLLGIEAKKIILKNLGPYELVAWITADPSLPPFHLLTHNPHSPYSHREDPSLTWPRLLREKKFFPLLAILQQPERPAYRDSDPPNPTHEIARWEIKDLKKAPLTPSQKALFTTPSTYFNSNHLLQPNP